MPFIELEELGKRDMVPGFKARFIHSPNMTISYWEVEAGAVLPKHSHPHEQVTNVIEGEFEMDLEGKVRLLNSGTVALIPPNAVHTGRALSPCRIIDVFYPVREDYRS